MSIVWFACRERRARTEACLRVFGIGRRRFIRFFFLLARILRWLPWRPSRLRASRILFKTFVSFVVEIISPRRARSTRSLDHSLRQDAKTAKNAFLFSFAVFFSYYCLPPTACPEPRRRACCLFFSFDHFDRPCQHVRRNRQADLLRRFKVDHQLKLRWLLDWYFGWLGPF